LLKSFILKKHCLSIKTITDININTNFRNLAKIGVLLKIFVKITKPYITIKYIAALLALISLSSCVSSSIIAKTNPAEPTVSLEREIDKSTQILLVTNYSLLFFTETNVYALEKTGGKWKKVFGSFDAVAGRNGFAPQGEKREGDGRTPSGIFSLQLTFGYNDIIETKMPYRRVLDDDLWIDDVNAPDYNRWVKAMETRAVSYEKMRRDDGLYKYGIVIEYNTNPVIKGYGSAIFFHVWGGKDVTTEGCVAVSEDNIIRILEWLDPKARPLIVMGNEYRLENFIK
jgi:L,D-peptidoglycan transpeptidase YkuD (ErfK/YbiS/YcfS/YnhG family)